MSTYYDSWMDDANCLGFDPDAFFIKLTTRTSRQDRIRLETAKTICEICPVKTQCSTLAKRDNLEGLYGGEYRRPKM